MDPGGAAGRRTAGRPGRRTTTRRCGWPCSRVSSGWAGTRRWTSWRTPTRPSGCRERADLDWWVREARTTLESGALLMDLNTLYHRTVESWADRVNAVAGTQWDDPTPCSEWTVRDLANHVVGEDLWTAPAHAGEHDRRGGGPLRRRPAGGRPDQDRAGRRLGGQGGGGARPAGARHRAPVVRRRACGRVRAPARRRPPRPRLGHRRRDRGRHPPGPAPGGRGGRVVRGAGGGLPGGRRHRPAHARRTGTPRTTCWRRSAATRTGTSTTRAWPGSARRPPATTSTR